MFFWRIWGSATVTRVRPEMTDTDLLHRFIHHADQGAFADLVRRHLDFVYGAALRHVNGDRHRAEDVCQQVFVDLARKAPSLAKHPCLMGWLYAGTRFTAINTIRREQRRAGREVEFEIMHAITSQAEPQWEEIRPIIDDAMQELDEGDRRSVLLRFFGGQAYAAIGRQLGLSENAAQKRVDRALDRLNAALVRRGIGSTSTALGLALAQSAVAAPGSLATAVTAAALAAGVGAGAGVAGAVNFMTITKILVSAAVAGAIGVAVGMAYERNVATVEAERLRAEFAAKLSEAEAKRETEAKRAVAAEADTAKLLTAIKELRAVPVVTKVQPPPPASTPAAAAVPILGDAEYVIRMGDSGAKIAAKSDLTLSELAALNPGVNWARLAPGQRVRIK